MRARHHSAVRRNDHGHGVAPVSLWLEPSLERGCGKNVRSSTRSALAVVNAAYQLDGSPGAWLRDVLRAARPVLGQGLGLCGYLYEINAERRLQFTERAAVGAVPDGYLEGIETLAETLTSEQVSLSWAHHLALDTGSASFERCGLNGNWDDFPLMESSRTVGVRDHLVAKMVDANRVACLLLAPLADKQEVKRRDEVRWRRVMVHVMAGLRLRGAPPRGDGDAVVAPDGRLLHAEADARPESAREALRRAARIIDKVNSVRGCEDPDAALKAWRGLVNGRWSLVDRFDSDGRRFLIARRNQPTVPSPSALTHRERQVAAYAALGHTNKRIAYTLGLAPSTVSSHLRSAILRLGLRSPAELAAVFSAPRASD